MVLLWQSRLSVCLSVTLMYPDHIGWNSLKIISLLVSLGCLLFADPNIMGLLQGEHTEILAKIGVGYGKSGFRHTKALIFLKHGKIGPRLLSLLLTSNSLIGSVIRTFDCAKINDLGWPWRSLLYLQCGFYSHTSLFIYYTLSSFIDVMFVYKKKVFWTIKNNNVL